MDIILGTLSLAGSAVLSFLAIIGHAWAFAAGLLACLWSIHLCRVQPAAERSEVGWSAQHTALLVAAPIFLVGLTAIVWAAGGLS